MLTLWIHSLNWSKLDRWAHTVLVFSDDSEHVLLSLHDADTLTLGRSSFDGLPPCVHLSISPLNNEARQVTASIILWVVPV